MTETDLRWTTWIVRYIDGQGRTKQKEFRTEAARTRWIEKSDGDIQILAYSDPQ